MHLVYVSVCLCVVGLGWVLTKYSYKGVSECDWARDMM